MNLWWISTLFYLATITCVNGIKILHGVNPGPCEKKNLNEIKLVRDRQNKPKLLICIRDKDVNAWRTVDGSRTAGEIFSPGYDCSSILDENPEAKDGVYWVDYGDKSPVQVWCDMTTDGGGFMLVGRKTSPKTWTVPSNNKVVKPFKGLPHWSSALGKAPVLDFRVQMAIERDLLKTKAHWFYRLQNRRKLKNLLIINRGGCNRNSPGIGDIAYVKDLQKGEIATTKFRCSKFGTGHHPVTKLGWYKMNLCLQKPCPRGFAFNGNSQNKTEVSGGFSYSTKRTTSGNGDDATAFVGCDYNECCGCYGPKGGKKDYCLGQCRSKNGGTITKKVFTWFWVRSTLPKRLWRECMEYNVTKNGVVVWYKLVNGGTLPVKGRCVKNEALLYDGIVVVPDNVTAKKVPSVDGLIMYRKDKKKLYVTEDKKWNAIAQEKKMNDMLNKDIMILDRKVRKDMRALADKLEKKVNKIRSNDILLLEKKMTAAINNSVDHLEKKVIKVVNTSTAQLQKKIASVNQTLTKTMNKIIVSLSASVILRNKKSYRDQLKRWLPKQDRWILCYRASQDGWKSTDFHTRCDHKGPTVTIIRVGSYIFGGYTDKSWGGSSRYISSSNSFIFSFRNKYNSKPFKSTIYRYSQYAIYTSSGYGPTFGGGHDIYVANNAYASTSSHSNLGYTYRPPSGYSYGNSNTKAFLAGSYKFKPSEVEVFY